MRALLVLPLLVAACGGSQPASGPAAPPPAPPAGPASTVQQQLGWMVGRWESTTGIEHWTAAGDALFGVSFTVNGGRTTAYEALMVRDVGGTIVYEAAPGGAAPTGFRLDAAAGKGATFVNREHDFPQEITYRRGSDTLTATLHGARDQSVTFSWSPGAAAPAPELEAADKAWSDEVGRRGVDAWVANFDPEGVQRGSSEPRITGVAAIRAAMEPVLAGSFRLIWWPVASGRSPAGDLGYTVGEYVYKAGDVDQGRGAYVTIWRRQADGSWKVLYDAGDPAGT